MKWSSNDTCHCRDHGNSHKSIKKVIHEDVWLRKKLSLAPLNWPNPTGSEIRIRHIVKSRHLQT